MPTVTNQLQSQEHNLNFCSSRSYLCTPAIAGARGTEADTHAWYQLRSEQQQKCLLQNCEPFLAKTEQIFLKWNQNKSLWNGHSDCQQKTCLGCYCIHLTGLQIFTLVSNQSSNLLNANCRQRRREIASGKMLPRCLPMNSASSSRYENKDVRLPRMSLFTLEKAIGHSPSAQSTHLEQDSEHWAWLAQRSWIMD